MIVRVVIENTSTKGLPVEHGLSLWIEACGRRFFFDLGQGELFAENAAAMGLDVADAEFAIVSHGHYDHGGGIKTFLLQNKQSSVYLNVNALCGYYSKSVSPKDSGAQNEDSVRYIGLDSDLRFNGRIVLTDGVRELSEGLILFSGCTGREWFSPANDRILKMENGVLTKDDFLHEQSLVIWEGSRRVLVAGCAHSGILNIMAKAENILGEPLTDVIGGFHLAGVDDIDFMDNFARELMRRSCRYYT